MGILLMIIAFCGAKNVGKDLAANKLIDMYKFKKLSFAQPLKQMVSEVFEIPFNMLEDNDKKDVPSEYVITENQATELNIYIKSLCAEIGMLHEGDISPSVVGKICNTPRQLLQLIGSDVVRDLVYGNLWVDLLAKRMYDYTNVVITDCRFANERKILKDQGGILVKINRNTGLTDTHISETSLGSDDEYDVIINNNKMNVTAFQSQVSLWYLSRRQN